MAWDLKMSAASYVKKYGDAGPRSEEALEELARLAAGGSADFETSVWNGLTNYHCPICAYATLKREALSAHVLKHGPIFGTTGTTDE